MSETASNSPEDILRLTLEQKDLKDRLRSIGIAEETFSEFLLGELQDTPEEERMNKAMKLANYIITLETREDVQKTILKSILES